MNLLEYAIAIEATAAITYGVIKGGIEVRRFIAGRGSLVLAYFLPTLLGLAPPGSLTYFTAVLVFHGRVCCVWLCWVSYFVVSLSR
ncbi:hypothetical protein [Vulcanisaeta sp. JCM 14467]|uniref:hypothetical protein n=1 Tax=Vulcanisaeta sp. JCM 14467 TaxID=1295370 RepID=UPI0006D24710|nr:hypothetical protein [Vulcanisaeta sp. JCM 14467]